jgi:hypothetical protein
MRSVPTLAVSFSYQLKVVECQDKNSDGKSIADTYLRKPLSQSLASLSGTIGTCPATGRQFIQKQPLNIFGFQLGLTPA